MSSQNQDLNKSDEAMNTNTFECPAIPIKLSKNLEALHESREFSDLILIGSDGIQIRTHRIILCATSQYFQESCHSMPNTKPMQIEVKEFERSTLESIIQFMYTGSIHFCLETVGQVLRAAEQFQIQPLLELCFDFIEQELNGSNCLNTATFAKEYDYMQLYEDTFYFACDHFEEICSGIDFLNLDGKMLDDILSSDEVVVSSEEKIVQCLLIWLQHDEKNREESWETRLSSVRYQFLTHKFILENISGLCINLNSHKLIHRWLQWHLFPDKRSTDQQDIASPRESYQTAKIVLVTGYFLNELKVQTYYPEFNDWTYTNIESSWDNLHSISTTVDKDLVIIAGGVKQNGDRTNEIKFYNMKTEETDLLPSMRIPRSDARIAVLNGCLYVAGGKSIVNNKLTTIKLVERYIFSEQEWEDVEPLLQPIFHDAKIAVLNDCLYVVSSENVQCYSTENNQWCYKTPKSEKCEYFGLVSSGGYLFTVGGRHENCQLTDTVERYNPLSDKWELITRLTSPRDQLMCLSFNNSFLVIGGTYNSKWIDTVEEYNTETNEWKTLAPLLFYELFIQIIF